ncbi:hypothetical protein DWX10_14650 [Clostridium sp. AF18-27]|uniref:hypothetical protein n=1 Tax=Enterocloster lavalensis TaxID=460384 RepID=UPI000E4C031E|nr:hypothetical protein [Enterocloster lavalensis]RHR52650.1 hypothetical protein DWX10_14650 [Clostridium sp. AF18-27]
MAITKEMRQQLEQTKAQWAERQRIGNSMGEELEALPKGPLHTDNRVITIFDGGAKTPDETRNYIRSYHRADSASRAPYLSHMFDDLLSYRHESGMTDMAKMEGSLARLRDYSAKFCYSENLIKDNQEYFDSHYTTAQARVIAAGRDLFSDSTGILSYALNTNGYTYTLDARDPEARMTDSRTDAFLTAQTADFIYRQTMDAMEGNPVNSTMSLQVPEGTDKRIFFMAKDLDKGTLTPDSKACQSAVNVFDRMFSLPLNPVSLQGKEQAKLGKDIFDMIYIDGVPARQAFGKKYENATPSVQRDMMKAEVINAMTSGKNRLDLATLQRDGNNRLSVVVNRVQPDLRAVQPTIKEDYSAIRRVFNWGPFKCKTREEKQQTLLASDTDREKRHDQIARWYRKDIGELMIKEDHEAKNKALGKTAEERQKAHQLLQEAKSPDRKGPAQNRDRKGPTRTSASRGHVPTTSLTADDEAYFGKAGIPLGPDKTGDLNSFFAKNGEDKGLSHLYHPSDRRNIADLILLSQGYTLPQLLSDTPEMQTARAEAGNIMVNALSNPDNDAGQATLARLCGRGAQNLCLAEIPLADPSNPMAVAENHGIMERVQGMCGVWSGTMTEPFIRQVTDRLDRTQNLGPYRLKLSLDTLSSYSSAAQKLGNYYKSPDAVNPDATFYSNQQTYRPAPSPMVSGLSGKAVMETFSALVPGDTFRAASLPSDQLETLKNSMSAAAGRAAAALRDKANRPALRDYLRGDSPNPLPGSNDLKPLEVRSAVRSKDLMAEEKQSGGPGSRPAREAKSPESAPRETKDREAKQQTAKERESADKGFSR